MSHFFERLDKHPLGRAAEPAEHVWMDVYEVAEYFKVSHDRIYRLRHGRKIPCYRVGGSLRFNKQQIKEWVESGDAADALMS